MSQVCKYYLQGNCRYGHRCRFLHENAYGSNYSQGRSMQQNYYKNENYSRNYSQNQSYPHTQSHHGGYNNQHYERDHSQTHSKYHSQNYYTNTRSNYGDKQQNYHRYHVDNRQNHRERNNSEGISPDEFLEIVNIELIQHQQSHMWPLTVVAPIKDFGNIPGFKDWSPEEIRYQYYESVSNNTFYDFDKNMRDVLNEVAENRQVFRSKSSQALNILKTMIQKSKNTNKNNVTTTLNSPAAAAFSFDLSKLNANHPSINVDDMNAQSGVNLSFSSLPNANPLQPQTNAAGFFGSETSTSTSSLFGNPTPAFGVSSQIDTFSFNVNRIQPNQGSAIRPTDVRHPENITNINDATYSNFGQLTEESVEQFRAKIFKAGKIPLFPPPRELCMS